MNVGKLGVVCGGVEGSNIGWDYGSGMVRVFVIFLWVIELGGQYRRGILVNGRVERGL